MRHHFRLATGFLLLALGVSAYAAGLNDTGVTQCRNAAGTALEACLLGNSGDAAPYTRQDGRFGRDAAAGAGVLAKTGGGAAGFDFTPLDASGNAIAIAGGVPASTPACERDNVTGLIWEVKTPANWGITYTFASAASAASYAASANSANLCGFNTGWRVPTRRELVSIVHLGANNPSIDSNYFPNTQSNRYWSSDVYTPIPVDAWYVVFDVGVTSFGTQADYYYVRLARSGQ